MECNEDAGHNVATRCLQCITHVLKDICGRTSNRSNPTQKLVDTRTHANKGQQWKRPGPRAAIKCTFFSSTGTTTLRMASQNGTAMLAVMTSLAGRRCPASEHHQTDAPSKDGLHYEVLWCQLTVIVASRRELYRHHNGRERPPKDPGAFRIHWGGAWASKTVRRVHQRGPRGQYVCARDGPGRQGSRRSLNLFLSR